MLRKQLRRLLYGGFFHLCCAALLEAQIDTATVVGTIRDASGGIVASAEIKLRRTATNETFTTVTNSTGDYRVHPLPIGEYEITAARRDSKPK